MTERELGINCLKYEKQLKIFKIKIYGCKKKNSNPMDRYQKQLILHTFMNQFFETLKNKKKDTFI